jgi:four helix bundle protein
MTSYKDLTVWQKSYQLTLLTYKASKKFPKEEIFNLVSQIRRSAVSLPSNIAEGNYRGSKKEQLQFLRIAFASGAELETQLLLSKDLQYISNEEYNAICSLLSEVMKMLNIFIKNLSSKV